MKDVSKYKIAKSYATSWVDVSFLNKLEDTVLKEVEILSKSLKDDALLWQKIITPKADKTIKEDIIKAISKKMKLSKITSNLLSLVAENSRLDCLSLILDEWQELYYEKKSIVKVNIETVVPLTLTQDKKIKKVLEEKLKKTVKLNYIINKEILGGLKISYGSNLIDDSLQNKLENIKKLMLNR